MPKIKSPATLYCLGSRSGIAETVDVWKRTMRLNPIGYEEGGIFIPHHQSISCHSETTYATASKLCDFLLLPFFHNWRKF